MKTIVFNDTNVSAYQFDNAYAITMSSANITTPDFIIVDMDSTNATIHENVTPPVDWQGGKYTFDGTTWAEVEGWVDPKLAEISRLEEEIARLKAE
jgi:hypothetical protein